MMELIRHCQQSVFEELEFEPSDSRGRNLSHRAIANHQVLQVFKSVPIPHCSTSSTSCTVVILVALEVLAVVVALVAVVEK